ncbi:cysteine desulfurase sulfur acceptor subunit CsdE [Psychrosphaera haliotis]|uniref:SufE family protein n=1 Tax=Psychrosphaera haliotis TaxID=555083 RepID=UPI0031D6ADC0
MHQDIIEFSNQFHFTSSDILEILLKEKGWQNQYRRIMLLGKELPEQPVSLKLDDKLVAGCESNVWLNYQWVNGQLKLAASSDSKVVKGLITIILAAYNNKEQNQILDFKIESYLDELGLLQQLSPSRGNGIKAIVNKILLVAEQGSN